jgi:hypothetical protein
MIFSAGAVIWWRGRRGCCTGCGGSGYSGDSAVPGGMCWDCRGTGHSHAGRCRRSPWLRISRHVRNRQRACRASRIILITLSAAVLLATGVVWLLTR